jgi:pSer/pThr/pTyr-binding forkhead associated (FHA) protein
MMGVAGTPMATEKKPDNEVGSEPTLTLTKEMLAAGPTRRWALKLTYSGTTVTVEAGGNIQLGRDKTNDLVVESSLASRVHARIYERDGHFVLSDLSSNGTFLRNDGHMNEIVLRREEAMLGERGWIGLGRPTVSHGDHMLRYRLERVRA